MKIVIVLLLILISIALAIICFLTEELKKAREMSSEIRRNLELLNTLSWRNFSEPFWLENALKEKGYRSVAIDVESAVAAEFYRELEKTSISIAYVVERRKRNKKYGCVKLLRSDELPQVDAIIIAHLTHYEELYSLYEKKNIGDIIFVEELIEKW